MSIVVHTSKVEFSPASARALPRSSRGACWSGGELPRPFAWSIGVDSEALWFVCSLPGGRVLASSAERGAFVEGLWDGDVAEVFIKSAAGRYQELNLAPSGAWWSMTLSDYRKRAPNARRPELLYVDSTVGDGQWEVVAAFKRRTLDVDITAESSVHVSGMWYRPQATFLSSHPPAGVDPDYHHGECFQSVSFTSVGS